MAVDSKKKNQIYFKADAYCIYWWSNMCIRPQKCLSWDLFICDQPTKCIVGWNCTVLQQKLNQEEPWTTLHSFSFSLFFFFFAGPSLWQHSNFIEMNETSCLHLWSSAIVVLKEALQHLTKNRTLRAAAALMQDRCDGDWMPYGELIWGLPLCSSYQIKSGMVLACKLKKGAVFPLD